MAMVNFKKGLLANLPAAITEGTLYVTTDERAIYLDVDGSTRIRIGDFQEFATLTALQANTNPSTTALYYVADVNCLAKWDGSKYVQINLDTGATSVEVVGEGNAVTASSYDPATRKLTLTKGETFVKTANVGNMAGKDKVAEADLEDALKEKVNAAAEGNHSHENKTVLDGITAEKVTAWDKVADKANQTDLDAVETKVTTLIGDDANKNARTIASEELAKQLIPENAQESLDTLAEIAAWIQAHPGDASAMNKAIEDLAKLVGTLPEDATATTVVGYIKEYADAAIAALKIGDYAKAADLTALATRVTTAEGKLDTLTGADTVDGSVAKALKDAKAYTDEKDTAMDTRVKAVEGKAHEHENKTVLDGITAAKVTAWDSAEQNAKGYTDTALTWGSF